VITFAVGVAIGIVLSCVVAWWACNFGDSEVRDLEKEVGNLMFQMDGLRKDNRQLTKRNDEAEHLLEIKNSKISDWQKEAEVCCESRDSLIRELQVLLEGHK
jgi:hypothetical protein